ncbi:cytochrome P450 4C1-like isoform X6 [Schistocerca serialis cubense]|uniref:cytochrome P450 4C1-like isoform X6 n=1 Tax=Schistocerca serialis cubense TaxID=2023355 RepID=UPI00214F410F|nr:cytochrome P450 4C1-like isoform X6 [Schistocerca serialis cubense]
MLTVTGLLAAVVVFAVSAMLLSRRWRVWRDVERIPGDLALPFLGNTYVLFYTPREDFMEFVKKTTKKFWPIHRLWLGPFAEVRITKPEHIEIVMASSDLITKADLYAFLHPWLGEGLLTSTGTKWHSHRKMITPAFHFTILDNFIEVFVEKAEVLVKLLKSKADGQAFDIYPHITRCTLDIICETAMGTPVDAQNNEESAYVNAVYSIGELTIKRIFNPLLHNDFIFRISNTGKEFYRKLDILHEFTRKVIRDKKLSKMMEKIDEKTDEIGRKRRVAFLDMLLAESEDGQKLTDQEVQEEVDTFMFEGHDTTSAAISWALVLLGHHPEIQENVHTELKDVFERDHFRGLTMQDLHNMKYLDMVIKEALRLYPSVPFIARKVTKDVQVGGYRIPEGVTVTMQICHTHRDPDHWPDPDRFDPDNFLPERVQGRHPFAYVPFSAGPRNCIGQKFAILEEKTVLSYVLRNFRVETVDRLEDLKLIGELVLRPMNGVNLRLWPR